MPKFFDPKKHIPNQDIAPYVRGTLPETKLVSKAEVIDMVRKIAEFFENNPEKQRLPLTSFPTKKILSCFFVRGGGGGEKNKKIFLYFPPPPPFKKNKGFFFF